MTRDDDRASRGWIRPGVRRLVAIARGLGGTKRQVHEELDAHVANRAEWLVSQGWSPGDARLEAIRRLGSIDDTTRVLTRVATRRDARDRLRSTAEALGADIKFAIRRMRRAPGFAAVCILALALGIGANATMVGITSRLLLAAPPHVKDPSGLFELSAHWTSTDGEIVDQRSFPFALFTTLRQRLAGTAQVAAATNPWPVPAGRDTDAQELHATFATASFFTVLGVRPFIGRFYSEDEDRAPTAAPVAVLGYGAWQRMFGGSNRALGSTLDVNGSSVTIIGVAPAGFSGLETQAIDLWMPVALAQSASNPAWPQNRNSTWLRLVVRPLAGTTTAAAAAIASAANLDAGEPRMATLHAFIKAWPIMASLRDTRQSTGTVATLLTGLSLLLVLIACANVASLLLARALVRRGEIAVRLAIGGSRGRLVSQLLTESVVLSLSGGVAAIAVAYWGTLAARRLLFGDIEWATQPLDLTIIVYMAGLALVTGVLVGLVPSIQSIRPRIAETLKGSARAVAADGTRVRAAMIATQCGLSVVLLIATALFGRSLRAVDTLSIGMEPDRALLATMRLQQAGFKAPAMNAIMGSMLDRVRALPGVAAAGLATTVPGWSSFGDAIDIPGRDSLPSPAGGGPFLNGVSPGFFMAMGTRIIRGRDFTDADEVTGATVVIINETLANAAWPGQNPIGQCLHLRANPPAPTPCLTVVGVTENTRRQNWIEDANYMLSLPFTALPSYMPTGGRVLLVRPSGDPDRLVEPVRKAMLGVAPGLPAATVRRLSTLYDNELRPWRLGAKMLGAFAFLAACLVAVGLYSTLSFTVAQRTREIGIRIALGARSQRIMSLVVRQGLVLVAAGAVAGAVASAALGRYVEPFLFKTSARDPLAFGAGVMAMVVVAVVAALVPAWRASRTDPAVALRGE